MAIISTPPFYTVLERSYLWLLVIIISKKYNFQARTYWTKEAETFPVQK